MTSSVADRMRAVTAKTLNVDPAKVTDDATFTEGLGADSFEVIVLFMDFELEFDIEVPDDTVETCRTFGEAVSAVSVLVQESDH